MNGKVIVTSLVSLFLVLGVSICPITAQTTTQTGSWQLHCVLAISFDANGANAGPATNVYVKVIWSQMVMSGITLVIPSVSIDKLSSCNTILASGTFTFTMADTSTMPCSGSFMLSFLLLGGTHPGTGVFIYIDGMHRGYFVGHLKSDGGYHVIGLLYVYMKQ
jgi:hypothetical protein